MRLFTFLSALILASLLAAAAPPSEDAPRILADHELGETPLLDDLRELCDRIGGRPTGAPSCERAVDWGVTKFKEAGSFDFLLSGVPNFVANQDAASYLPDYHAESDVFDMVDQREAKRNAAIAGVLLWGLAENPARPATRQTRAEVEKVLKETKLDDQMKSFGQWDYWLNGKRGVNKTE
jgi:hypothetical protein